eukprot:4730755-Pleurochrysis_carterae.AAC.1
MTAAFAPISNNSCWKLEVQERRTGSARRSCTCLAWACAWFGLTDRALFVQWQRCRRCVARSAGAVRRD